MMANLWLEFQAQLTPSLMLVVYAFGLLLVTWPVFLILERVSPAAEQNGVPRYAFNWKVVASNVMLTPACYAAAVALTASLGRAFGLPVLPYPMIEISTGIAALDAFVQGSLVFLVACFLGDLWYYVWHRAQHELPFLWEFHKLHHSDESMNATTIFRSHFFELAGQALVRGLTVGLFVDLAGAPQTVLVILAAGLAPPIWDILIHANVRMDGLHRLLPFFSTPQYHWIHHSRLPEHQDKNYAIWLPLFDVLFGSYYRPAPGEIPPTGLSSGERIDTLWKAQAGPIVDWFRRPAPAGVTSSVRSQETTP